MKIVIIGDGKVGYKLARQLSADDYDIVMIDSNERKLRFAIDRLDIFCVHAVLLQESSELVIRSPACVIRFILNRSVF